MGLAVFVAQLRRQYQTLRRAQWRQGVAVARLNKKVARLEARIQVLTRRTTRQRRSLVKLDEVFEVYLQAAGVPAKNGKPRR